jgi:hypothetical protein
MIVTWPLPFKTTQFAKSGFQMFLHVFFTFFFVGFVVSVAVNLLDSSLEVAQSLNHDVKEANKEAAKGFEAIVDAFYSQNFQEVNQATDLGLYGFLMLLFGCLFGFKFVNQAPKLAGKLSGDKGSLGLAPKVATMGASLAKGAAMRVSKPFAEAAVEKYHEAGGVIGVAGSAVSGVTKLPGGIGAVANWAGNKLEEKGWSKSARALRATGKGFSIVGEKTDKYIGGAARGIRGFSKKVHSAYNKKV